MKRWEHRFEVKPGRWVYVPTPIGKAAGEKIRSSVAKVWSRPKFYFHLRKGGHVAALQDRAASRRAGPFRPPQYAANTLANTSASSTRP